MAGGHGEMGDVGNFFEGTGGADDGVARGVARGGGAGTNDPLFLLPGTGGAGHGNAGDGGDGGSGFCGVDEDPMEDLTDSQEALLLNLMCSPARGGGGGSD